MTSRNKVGTFKARNRKRKFYISKEFDIKISNESLVNSKLWIKNIMSPFLRSAESVLPNIPFYKLFITVFPGIPYELYSRHIDGKPKAYILNWMNLCIAVSGIYHQVYGLSRYTEKPTKVIDLLKKADLRWGDLQFSLYPTDLSSFLQAIDGKCLDLQDLSEPPSSKCNTEVTLHVLVGYRNPLNKEGNQGLKQRMMEDASFNNFFGLLWSCSGDAKYWRNYNPIEGRLSLPAETSNISIYLDYVISFFLLISPEVRIYTKGHSEYTSLLLRRRYTEEFEDLVDKYGNLSYFIRDERYTNSSDCRDMRRLTMSFEDLIDWVSMLPRNEFRRSRALTSSDYKRRPYRNVVCNSIPILSPHTIITKERFIGNDEYQSMLLSDPSSVSTIDVEDILQRTGWLGSIDRHIIDRFFSPVGLLLPVGLHHSDMLPGPGFIPFELAYGSTGAFMRLLCMDVDALIDDLQALSRDSTCYDIIMCFSDHLTFCVSPSDIRIMFEEGSDELRIFENFLEFSKDQLGMDSEIIYIDTLVDDGLDDYIVVDIKGGREEYSVIHTSLINTKVTLKEYIDRMEGVRVSILNTIHGVLKSEYLSIGNEEFLHRYECVYNPSDDSFLARSYEAEYASINPLRGTSDREKPVTKLKANCAKIMCS